MSEYRILDKKTGKVTTIITDNFQVVPNYIQGAYWGQIQKTLRFAVDVTVKHEGETEFKKYHYL